MYACYVCMYSAHACVYVCIRYLCYVLRVWYVCTLCMKCICVMYVAHSSYVLCARKA